MVLLRVSGFASDGYMMTPNNDCLKTNTIWSNICNISMFFLLYSLFEWIYELATRAHTFVSCLYESSKTMKQVNICTRLLKMHDISACMYICIAFYAQRKYCIISLAVRRRRLTMEITDYAAKCWIKC